MTAYQATEEIIELVYHSAVVSDDPWVQEVHTSTAVRDILEEFTDARDASDEFYPTAASDLEEAKESLATLEKENQVLHSRLRAAEELRELSTP